MKRILSAVVLAALVSTFATAQSEPTKKAQKAAQKAEKKVQVAAAAKPATMPVAMPAVVPASAIVTPAPAAAMSVTTESPKIGGPVMTFEKTEIDYGTIAQGADPLRRFKFKNTGTEPLIIKDARGSCGCTVPSYKKEPIAPGESSEIEVRYDTQRIGDISKSVTITTNEGDQARVLMIRGKVTEKPVEVGVPANAPSLLSAPKQ